MPTMKDAADRATILSRIDRLSADATPQWGRMSAPQMMAHITDACRMAMGELAVTPKNIPFLRMFPFKQLVLHVLPFPKNAPTAPEIVSRTPTSFDAERMDAKAAIERVATFREQADYAVHPVFGQLTPAEWGVLSYRHIDHHLRQFGV